MKYVLGALAFMLLGCATDYEETHVPLEAYTLAQGFELSVLAAEPLLDSTVAIDFDDLGRMWVVEMCGFLENLESATEETPSGSIKILEDRDGDGAMDHAKVFLDSLVMPRALAHVYGGLLYAEPPRLWFVEIENDRPKNKVLVDAEYAPEGNPEHQPNGLVMNIDNWIYSAKSNYRYQRKNGEWIKEPTSYRGQWGIAQDNFGRLYYNSNSKILLGDYMFPNILVRNRHFAPKYGIGEVLTETQRVFPMHAASVNRGYMPGVLNADSLLQKVTAACGPTVYRGGVFPEGYAQNAFSCIPEANLIKRTVLGFHGDSISAGFAWPDKEFLASTDEGFRPVNLNNGPDGALYIVDMHRGVIQHHAYLSPYLRERSKEKGLDTLIDYGRILRVQAKGAITAPIPDFSAMASSELVDLLGHTNGWIRDRAQRHLILRNDQDIIGTLNGLLRSDTKGKASLHALYALKGMGELELNSLLKVLVNQDAELVAAAIHALEGFVDSNSSSEVFAAYSKLSSKAEPTIDLYLASTMARWARIDARFYELVGLLLRRYEGRPLYREAFLSGLEGPLEMDKLQALELAEGFYAQYEKMLASQEMAWLNPIYRKKSQTMDSRTRGSLLYSKICSACHGSTGAGIVQMAPPLLDSEYISGDTERLAKVLLHGLSGPVTVNSTTYEYGHVMPGLRDNPEISDADINALLSFVTNAFSDGGKGLSTEKIKEIRATLPESGGEYTEVELNGEK
jgi:mono/diheme cytochrome c family protein/glucose/arabinose dehydrogenase